MRKTWWSFLHGFHSLKSVSNGICILKSVHHDVVDILIARKLEYSWWFSFVTEFEAILTMAIVRWNCVKKMSAATCWGFNDQDKFKILTTTFIAFCATPLRRNKTQCNQERIRSLQMTCRILTMKTRRWVFWEWPSGMGVLLSGSKVSSGSIWHLSWITKYFIHN